MACSISSPGPARSAGGSSNSVRKPGRLISDAEPRRMATDERGGHGSAHGSGIESDARPPLRHVGFRLWLADLAPRIRFQRPSESGGDGMATTPVHLFALLPRDARSAGACP